MSRPTVAMFDFACMLALATIIRADINSDILNLYQTTFTGEGTYYGAGRWRGGICQFQNLPYAGSNSLVNSTAAINQPQYFNSIPCGMCFKVTGNGVGRGLDPISGEYLVFVADLCPECKTGDIDLALTGDGRWDITMHAVQCPVADTNLQYMFQGSNPFYLKLQIRNHRVPVTAVSLNQLNRGFTPMIRTRDGFWILDQSFTWDKPIPFPITIQMTSFNGETLIDQIQVRENDVVIDGVVQFSLDSSIPAVSVVTSGGPTTAMPSSASSWQYSADFIVVLSIWRLYDLACFAIKWINDLMLLCD